MPTRINEAPMSLHRVPSLMSSTVPVTTAQGVGKMTLRVSTTINHHAPSNTAMTANAGRLSFILFILCNGPENSSRSPHEPPPGIVRLRIDDHGHLSACMRRAGELITAGHFERQAEALTRHHQGRTEYLRHVIQVLQQQYVPDTDSQINCGRQNFHLVSRHAPRPGPFGNFEGFL